MRSGAPSAVVAQGGGVGIGGGGFGVPARGLINLVDGGKDGVGGNGRAGKAVHVAFGQGKGLALKLVAEGVLQGAFAIIFRFVKAVVADDNIGNGQVLVQHELHGHGAAEALRSGAPSAVVARGGGVGIGGFRIGGEGGFRRGKRLRLVWLVVARGLIDLVDGGKDGVGGNGRAGKAVHVAFGQGKGLALKLVAEGVLQGAFAIIFRFVKAVVADDNIGNGQVLVQHELHGHGAAEALGSGAPSAVFIQRRPTVGILIGGGGGGSFRACQLAVYGIDRVHDRGGRNGRPADRVNVGKLKRRFFADELAAEGILQRLESITGSFVKIVVSYDNGGNGAFAVKLERYGYRSAEALRAGGVGRTAAAQVRDVFARQVDAAVYGGRGTRGAGDGVNGIVALRLAALDQLQRNLFAQILVGKGRLLSQRAQAGGFAEVFSANLHACNKPVAVQADRYGDIPAIAGHRGLNHVSNGFAVFIQALIATIHPAAVLKLHLRKGGRGGKQLDAGAFRRLQLDGLNGPFGQLIGQRKQQRGNQADADQQA